ncbi:WhiB family transcriptional regulator [Streptomyces ochraceiscleroticus]|uniref:WhiB family transcriptional regulator n=1 Tax=Streptomyces ochraceiscleroticus TaxID=47761 RepID=A0ABW1MBM3_9ACTN|nr:WhiB family transcriptional regulator [Streptomyces ochraceiscleroticus]
MREFEALAATAREMCASCPLWAECLQSAVVHADPYGYAAATTADDRRWMRRALKIGDAEGSLRPAGADQGTLGELTREQRRHPEASQREMAVRLGCSRSTVSRRLAQVRARTDEFTRRPRRGEAPEPELGAILDAFDALQDHLAADRGISVRVGGARSTRPGAGETDAVLHVRCDEANGGFMSGESERRIAFSLGDPAAAVRQAVLWPLARTAAPALAGAENLVAMLIAAPGSGVRPETLTSVRLARRAVESLLPDEPEPAADVESLLQGSVSVELATTNPMAALRQAFLVPLLRHLVSSLANIETVGTMLAAVPGAEAAVKEIETIRTARQYLERQLAAGVREDEAAGLPGTDAGQAAPDRPPADGSVAPAATPSGPFTPRAAGEVRAGRDLLHSVPAQLRRLSIRAAVEQAVATVPEPFTGRDLIDEVAARSGTTLPGESAKAVSNVLSAMVKSGRLRRLSRGTYVRAQGPAADAGAAGAPDTPET